MRVATCIPLCVLTMATSAVAAQELPPDVVAVTGAQLPHLFGVSTTEIVALASHGSNLAPTVFQIDQRYRAADGNLRYVFEAGDDLPPAHRRDFGPDDLLLLSVPDAGERLAAPPAGYTEIEVVDPRNTSHGWLYVGRGAAQSLPPRVRYDASTNRIAGADYAIGFSRSGTAVIESLVLGDPEQDGNILDRNKARLDVDLAFGFGHVSRSEDDVRVRTTGLHVGPLRIIRESEVRGRMLMGFYSPPVRDDFIFYAHGFVLPTTIRVTPGLRLLVRDVTLRISMDLDDTAIGMTFQSDPEVPAPITVDGSGGRRGGTRPIAWYLLRRGDVGLLGWLQARNDITAEVTLYYRDDRSNGDPPERSAGELADHGFLFHHTGVLPAGDVHLVSHAWVLHGQALDNAPAEVRFFATSATVRVH